MTGARARGYRVDFIAVHWYGGDFDTGPAVQQLQGYLQAVYDRYHLPVWLTEFALPTSAGSGTTGLFNPGPSVTPVGQAFEAAR